MLGSVTFTLEGAEPETVEPTLGDMAAWEREHDAHSDQLAQGRVSDIAWLAWHAWQRSGGTLPYPSWEARLVDLDASPPPDPSPAAAPAE